MALSKKQLHENLRKFYIEKVSDFLTENGEEVLRTNSNEIAIPCVDEENNEEFLVLTFKVPTGSREGDAYDGYSMAQDYEMTIKKRAEKAKEIAEKKAKKIAKDAKLRESKAKIAAEKESRV